MGHQGRDQASGYLSISEAHPDCVYWFTHDIRKKDWLELKAITGCEENPRHVLSAMVEQTDCCFLIHGGEDDSALGVLGFSDWPLEQAEEFTPALGIWMLPTQTLLQSHLRALVRQTKEHILPTLLRRRSSIGNYILQSNPFMLKFLHRLGFEKVHSRVVGGLTFDLMVLRRSE